MKQMGEKHRRNTLRVIVFGCRQSCLLHTKQPRPNQTAFVSKQPSAGLLTDDVT